MATGKYESKPVTVTTTVYTFEFTEEELVKLIERCATGRIDPAAQRLADQCTAVYNEAHPDTKNPKPTPIPDDTPDPPKKITVIKP